MASDTTYTIEQLLEIMAQLRDPQSGCPWDRQQTFRSIVPHTLEEAYEVAAAAEADDIAALRDELGDLLFQVVFLARIAEEQEQFDFSKVVSSLGQKLVRRHPHVFADETDTSESALSERWEALKAQERKLARGGRAVSALDDVPLQLPATTRAQKLQRRAARAGFDWRRPEEVICKINEEISEVESAMASGDADAVFHEVGDLLMACTNLARHLGIESETALRAANSRFERRYRRMEQLAQGDGVELGELPVEAQEAYWLRAKSEESKG